MNSLHITLHQLQSAVHSDSYSHHRNSHSRKGHFSAFQLKSMNFCGILYFVTVTIFIFFTTLEMSLPIVIEDQDSRTVHTFMGLFVLLNLIINFILINCYDSIYEGKEIVRDASDLPSTNWNKCSPCNKLVPPRAHHCVLCRKCILKRDHHCFFTGTCVGFHNQRFFVVFCFYAAVGCIYALVLNWQFAVMQYPHPLSRECYSYILPVTVVQWMLGYKDSAFMCTVLLLYACAMSASGSGGLFAWQIFMISMGMTTHEYTNTGLRKHRKGIHRVFREVFGSYWILNFVIPLPCCFKTEGNGVTWDTLKTV